VSKNDKGEFSAKRLEEGGPVLGLVEYAGFQQAQVEVGAGDLLILYSDGVGEAMNAAGEEFGEERLIASIREKWDSQAGDIRDNILVRVAAFLNGLEPHDDQTLMVARLRNAQGEHQWQIAEDAKPEKVLAGS
jgi:serine phosphatase RsbU (regulator of sigma subunit)